MARQGQEQSRKGSCLEQELSARALCCPGENAPAKAEPGPGAAAVSPWHRVLLAQGGPSPQQICHWRSCEGFCECILWMGDTRGRSAYAYQVSPAVSSHLFLSAYLHQQAMRTETGSWGFPWVWQQELWLASQIAEILDVLIVCMQINSVLQAS